MLNICTFDELIYVLLLLKQSSNQLSANPIQAGNFWGSQKAEECKKCLSYKIFVLVLETKILEEGTFINENFRKAEFVH